MSDKNSLSSVEVSSASKTKLDSFSTKWQSSLKSGWKTLKTQNKKAKKVVIKGGAHKSSTVKEHTDIVSCQLQDENGNYLGSAHIDETGKAHPNPAWVKNAGGATSTGSTSGGASGVNKPAAKAPAVKKQGKK